MSTILPTYSNNKSHSEALELSQKTPQYLQKQAATPIPTSIPLLSTPESSEQWATYEQLLLSCLRTGDEKSAHLCLERLVSRFGALNERVMGLRGLYQEAVAEDDAALEKVLKEYDTILSEDPTIVPVIKRRITLLKTLSRTSEAIGALVRLLEMSPTDAEAWAELSDLYFSELMYPQSCFCLEEVLLITPNAWNVHARLGEILYMSTFSPTNSNEMATEKLLADAVSRYCRSIELCDGYLRGYYGLKLATDRLLELSPRTNKGSSQAYSDPRLSLDIIRKLNQKAETEIKKIVTQINTRNGSYTGYDEAEIISAKALLDQNLSKQ